MYGRCFVGLCVKGGSWKGREGKQLRPRGFSGVSDMTVRHTWLWLSQSTSLLPTLKPHTTSASPSRSLLLLLGSCKDTACTCVLCARVCVRERGRMKKRQIGICKCLVNLGCLLPPCPREPVQLDEYVESLCAAVAVRKVLRMFCSGTRQLPGVSRG